MDLSESKVGEKKKKSFSFILQGSLMFPLYVPGPTVWAACPLPQSPASWGTGDQGWQLLACSLQLLNLSILVWLSPKPLLLSLLGSEEETSASSPCTIPTPQLPSHQSWRHRKSS